MSENTICGACTACCKSLGIAELDKPALQWCQHCDIGKGCTIYQDRPRSCHTYTCLYYQGVEEGEHPWPLEMRPDRSHVIVDFMPATGMHYVRVDPSRPDAWKKPLVQYYLKSIAVQGYSLSLVIGEKCVPLKLTGVAR
jgi:hypothetical protein